MGSSSEAASKAEWPIGGMFRYWGKASSSRCCAHLLVYHQLDVAAVAYTYLDKDISARKRLVRIMKGEGCEREVLALVTTFLALHDIGKFSPVFQFSQPEACRLIGADTRSRVDAASKHHSDLGKFWWDQEVRNVVHKSARCFSNMGHLDAIEFAELFDPIAEAIAGHHGEPASVLDPYAKPDVRRYFRELEISSLKEYLHEIQFLSSDCRSGIPRSPDLAESWRQASWWLAGMCVLCDWLGSSERWFRFRSTPMGLEEYWQECALPAAELAVKESGICSMPAKSYSGMAEFLPPVSEPRPAQILADSLDLSQNPTLFILEDETGSGKTEAAGILAHRLITDGNAAGLAVLLPTMATTNAMHARMGSVFETLFQQENPASIMTLSHSARMLNEAYSSYLSRGEVAGPLWLADHRKKALLAPLCVATIDQALMAAINTRHQALRLWGLSGHVVVVDEVHACDTYMLRLLGNLLKFHAAAGGSAILLSATLPQNTRQRLVDSFAEGIGDSVVITDEKNDYPLMTRVDGAVVRSISLERSRALRTICVTCVDNREDVLQELARRTEEGNCSCWIRNTVDEAIEAYESVKARIPDAVVMLFHARFVMGDRIRIEKEVLEMFGRTSSTAERRGRILIATQVVEQSLDLDFDFMVIDLAPIDLVLQRVGRLHRHSRNAEGRVYDGPDCRTQPRCLVLAPPWNDEPDESWLSSAMPGTAAVYRHHGRLWLTLKLLRERELPGDQRALVEDVYSRAAILPEALERVEDAAASKDAAERSVAGFGCLDLEAGYSRDCPVWLDERQTPTRLGDRTSTLRLIREENTEFVPWHREGAHPWENSEVSVRFWLVADAHSSWHSGGEREQRALQSMPDAGRWIIPVVMREVVGGKWLGDAKRQDGTDIQLRYDRVTGLRFEREGGDTWDSI